MAPGEAAVQSTGSVPPPPDHSGGTPRPKLTLIRAPEGHSCLQAGVYPAEMAEERLHLLAGQLALLWGPGIGTGNIESLVRLRYASSHTGTRSKAFAPGRGNVEGAQKGGE